METISLSTLAILALNFGLSWWNCYAVGGMWAESKAIGGFARLLAWSGAIMAALGFSSVFIFLLLGLVHATWPLLVGPGVPFPAEADRFALSFWYVLVVAPWLGSGIVITIHSWIALFRERSLLSLGVTAWNTYAQVHNTLSAIETLGPALKTVGEGFASLFAPSSKDSAQSAIAKLAIGLALAAVILSLVGGAVLAAALIKRYAGRLPMPRPGAGSDLYADLVDDVPHDARRRRRVGKSAALSAGYGDRRHA